MLVNHDDAAFRIVALRTGGKITIPKPFRDIFIKDDRLVEISLKEDRSIVLHEFDFVKQTRKNLKLIGSRKMDLKGCLVIPIKARQALGIREKDYLEISQVGDQIIIKKYIINN